MLAQRHLTVGLHFHWLGRFARALERQEQPGTGILAMEFDRDTPDGPVLRIVHASTSRWLVRSGPGPNSIELGNVGAARERPERVAARSQATADDPMMREARAAFIKGDLDRAVALYTRLSETAEMPLRADALEFLGVTRQRKGQLAHAKAIFDRYLQLYPQGSGAGRVRQRLAAMAAPPAKSRRVAQAAVPSGEQAQWDLYGSHSSYVRRNTVSLDQGEDIENLSMWLADVDVVARRRGGRIDIMSRLTAGYREDFTDVGRDRSGSTVSNAYVDIRDHERGMGVRVGRQSRSGGGVYGRFDGAWLSYDLRDSVTLNAVAGYPVLRSDRSFDGERRLVGVSGDFTLPNDRWNLTAFANHQTVGDVTDRQAVGGEFRYFRPGSNVYGLVDFDTLYSMLNAYMLSGSFTRDSGLGVHASLDFRRSPLLSTSNALIGQGATTIDELEQSFTEEELQALAEDNTANNASYSVGLTWPLSERLRFSADLSSSRLETAARFSNLIGSQPVTETLSLRAQIVAASLWRERDAWIAALNVSDSDTYRTGSLTLDSRLPITQHIRIRPALRLIHRENLLNGEDEWIVSPGLRARVRWQRRFVIEAEIRGDQSTRTTLIGDQKRSSWYVNLGYRADFGR